MENFPDFASAFLKLNLLERAFFVRDRLGALGFSVNLEKIPGVGDLNVLAKPKDRPSFLLLSHHDGPGANDNATGTYALIKLAESLTAGGPSCFLSTGGEERGITGALHFVKSHRAELKRLKAAINIDAVGAGPLLFVHAPQPSTGGETKLETLALNIASDMNLPTVLYRRRLIRDEIAFRGVVPTIGLSWRNPDGTLPFKHTSEDAPKIVDAPKVEATINFVLRLLRSIGESR
jgi:hypothetical protein